MPDALHVTSRIRRRPLPARETSWRNAGSGAPTANGNLCAEFIENDTNGCPTVAMEGATIKSSPLFPGSCAMQNFQSFSNP
jgi:hypothetical protein